MYKYVYTRESAEIQTPKTLESALPQHDRPAVLLPIPFPRKKIGWVLKVLQQL
jgi:hypothetical protein